MLSRVAAVMAPRTHNRRRVTGSSGRRREGRESERQRPNMSRHLFYSAVLLLLVVMMCCGAGAAHAAKGNQRDAINPFKGTTSLPFANWKELKEDGREITSLRVPGLVELGDDVFAVAEAQCKEKDGARSCAGIVSKHLEISGDSMDISTSDISLFCMQLVDTAADNFWTTEMLRPTTLVLEDSVYMLLGNYSHTKQQVQGKNERGLLLVKGTLAQENGKKKIRWNETHAVKPQPKGNSYLLTELVGGGGSGFVMHDGALVFPMQTKKEDGESVLLSMRLPKSGSNWELSSETPGEGCRDPTLVKWKQDEYDERLSMMAHCAGGYYDVYWSTSDGVNWNGHLETITRVWGNSHKRAGYGVQSGSTTAIIEKKEVMLITAPVYAAKEDTEGVKGRLHLWVTDGGRVYDVGPVSREDDDAAASSLLMKAENKELILLYENKKKDDGSYNLVAVRLTDKVKRIKEVVKTWKDLDSHLKKCGSGSSGTVDVRRKGMCNDTVPTEGLVGFLSGNSTGTEWRDEYLGVNATVHGPAEKRRGVPNGLTFQGSWAEWPVGNMGQTVPYYFANSKFTLVATVSIHEVPEESSSPIPLIGVRMNDTNSTVLFGLSYTHDKKWLAIGEDPGDEDDVDKWEPNETYQVALKMDTASWTVFVDQEDIHKKRYNGNLFVSRRISHFYIGGDSKNQIATGGHVTVTNVMLYNDDLSDFNLNKLKTSKVTIPSLGDEKNSTEQAVSTGASVALEPKRGEDTANNHAQLNEIDPEKQRGKNSVDEPVAAAPPSTVAAGLSVPESATAAGSAETSRPGDSAQLFEGKTARQAALNEGNKSMERDSEVRPKELQLAGLTDVTDFDSSSESDDIQPRVEEEEADDRRGGSKSSLAASLSMDTDTGTGAAGAERSLSLEAGDRHSERSMNSDSSLTLPKSDAEPTFAEETDDSPRAEGAEITFEDGEKVPQTADTAPGNTTTTPGDTKVPLESNPTIPSDTDISLEHAHVGELAAMGLVGDSTVHGCLSWLLLLLLLLGLWGTAALC
ncbi:trans-sialidase, putative [Trypanosoma cruzi marinkellei]|uniref:Trans-sialidase, putative n=1 Tax=Trypanosoma cruzi marinkellei TaxID=85056 RepID=K2M3T3_TRYCR|nr:trans-sialidase, putative [Trypanosoma cruzi marinkellei]